MVRLKGYGKHEALRASFTLKRLFGEYSMAYTVEDMAEELTAKSYLCNHDVNL